MRCVKCGSENVVEDGDIVEPLEHPDRATGLTYQLDWLECLDCGYLWN